MNLRDVSVKTIFLAVVLLLTAGVQLRVSAAPTFGTVTLLTYPTINEIEPNEFGVVEKYLTATLTAQGSYAVASLDDIQPIQDNPSVYRGTLFMVWDVQDLSRGDSVRELAPMYTVRLFEGEDESIFFYFSPGFAVSPDERYVAILLENRLEIRTFPDFLPHAAISSTQAFNRLPLSWSPDGKRVAALFEGEVVVWEASSNTFSTYTLDTLSRWSNYDHPRLQAMENGLLIDNLSEELSISFVFCSWSLSDCTAYHDMERSFATPMLDGRTIIAWHTNEEMTAFNVWQLQVNQRYVLTEQRTWNLWLMPLAFSPTGNYLHLINYSEGVRSGDIWRSSDWTRIQRVSNREPVWLPAEDYFITLDPFVLKLFHIGRDEVLTEVDLWTALPPALHELFNAEEGTINVDVHGEKALIDLGSVAVVVDIRH
jgi:hypothetical protein